MLKPLLLCVGALAFVSTSATAASVANAQANIANPDFVIGFDEVVVNGPFIGNEFAAFGATFSGLEFSARGFAERPNTSGALLFRFPVVDASILFNDAVSDATFALGSNNGTATFTSLLNGVTVETFTASIVNTAATTQSGNNPGNVFGFTGSLFDEIRFTTSGSTGASFDNLSFNAADVAPVPVPATLPLLLVGAGAFAILRRRKKS